MPDINKQHQNAGLIMEATAIGKAVDSDEGGEMATCEHFEGLTTVAEPTSDVCDRCLAVGDAWVHLRACLMCGLVGCCDSSKNKHARQHWVEDGHPLERSIEPGETWQYCFEDGVGIR